MEINQANKDIVFRENFPTTPCQNKILLKMNDADLHTDPDRSVQNWQKADTRTWGRLLVYSLVIFEILYAVYRWRYSLTNIRSYKES